MELLETRPPKTLSTQKAGFRTIHFQPEELLVITFKYNRGKLYFFSPLQLNPQAEFPLYQRSYLRRCFVLTACHPPFAQVQGLIWVEELILVISNLTVFYCPSVWWLPSGSLQVSAAFSINPTLALINAKGFRCPVSHQRLQVSLNEIFYLFKLASSSSFFSFNVINPNLMLTLILLSNSHIKLKLLL